MLAMYNKTPSKYIQLKIVKVKRIPNVLFHIENATKIPSVVLKKSILDILHMYILYIKEYDINENEKDNENKNRLGRAGGSVIYGEIQVSSVKCSSDRS